jgi:hypothetical protein
LVTALKNSFDVIIDLVFCLIGKSVDKVSSPIWMNCIAKDTLTLALSRRERGLSEDGLNKKDGVWESILAENSSLCQLTTIPCQLNHEHWPMTTGLCSLPSLFPPIYGPLQNFVYYDCLAQIIDVI